MNTKALKSPQELDRDAGPSANYEDFSLVGGGLIYAATAFLRRKSDSRMGRIRTAIALSLITWLPMLVMALLEGTLHDDEATISFSEDFAFHVRFLLVVPFLILIEQVVNRSFVGYVKTSDRIIPDEQQGAFNNLVARLDKLTNSYAPEILMLIVVYGSIIIYFDDLYHFDYGRNYLLVQGTDQLRVAGWYYMLVCLPVFTLLVFRWFWRWILWLYSLVKISRFKLQIDPLHADQMAGLEYLNLSPLTFSFILVAPSALLASMIGIDITYHGALFLNYSFQIAVYVIVLPMVLYAPLLIFIPKLIKAKSYGILEFGSLLRKHNRDYARKWISGKSGEKEALLGSMDNSSLADINGSYTPVQNMKMFPANYKMIGLSIVLNLIPYIPLVFTYYSASELFKDLIKSVIGG